MEAEHNKEILESLFLSNYQLGVITRFASEIAKITSTEELTKRIQAALVDIGLSGLFKVSAQDNRFLKHFGNSINRDVFQSVEGVQHSQEKICAKDNFILFRLTKFILILDATNLEEEQIDSIKDNLAIFCDIIDSWVVNFVKMQKLRENIARYKEELVTKIDMVCHNIIEVNDEVQSKHKSLSQELLTNLSARFLTLALEPDQEDEIMNNTTSTINTYGEIIEDQVGSNNDILNILVDIVEFLKKQDEAEKEAAETEKLTISNDELVLF